MIQLTAFLDAGGWGLGTGGWGKAEAMFHQSPAPNPQSPNGMRGIGLLDLALSYYASIFFHRAYLGSMG